MEEKKNLASDSLILSFVQCVTMCTGIAQTMLLSRYLTKIEYGTYSQGMLVINFVIPLTLLGLANAVTYFSGQAKADVQMCIEAIIELVLVLGVIAEVIILLAQKPIIHYFNNELLESIIFFMAIRPLLMNLITIYQTLFVAYSMSRYVAIRNFIISIMQTLIIFTGAVILCDIRIIFILMICMDIVQLVFFSRYFNKTVFVIRLHKINYHIFKSILSYSLPLALSTMVGTLSIYMDKLIIGNMMKVEDFAMYSNMSKELPFSFVVTSFTTVVMPVLIRLKGRGDKEKFITIWKNYLEFGYYTTWILGAGAIVCAPELLQFLYSDKYMDGIYVFIVYLLISLLRFSYFGMVLTAYGKTKIILISSVITLLLNLVLNILLIIPLGMLGPAIASFIVIFFMNFLQLIMSCKYIDCSIWKILEGRKVTQLLLEIVFFGGIVYFIKSNLVWNYFLKMITFYMLDISILLLLNRKQIINTIKNLNS